LIPVGFGYGDGDEFFMRGWVWDSETRPCPAPLPSLEAGRENRNQLRRWENGKMGKKRREEKCYGCEEAIRVRIGSVTVQ